MVEGRRGEGFDGSVVGVQALGTLNWNGEERGFGGT